MFLFAHHMGVELFGREYAPQGIIQHVCVFAGLGMIAATSAYGTWMLAMKLFERARERSRV